MRVLVRVYVLCVCVVRHLGAFLEAKKAVCVYLQDTARNILDKSSD